MASPLENAIQFLKDLGFFDVVLPFLLVFTIVFAILEKTKILGTEDNDGKTPKKNLNSMVGFVFALLVVSTNKIVTALNLALPNIVLLLVVAISFLLLIGVFYKSGELDFTDKHKGWYAFFVFLIFIGVILIFLGAIQTDDGESWLGFAFDYIVEEWEGTIVSSFIFLAVAIGAILYITKSSSTKKRGVGE